MVEVDENPTEPETQEEENERMNDRDARLEEERLNADN